MPEFRGPNGEIHWFEMTSAPTTGPPGALAQFSTWAVKSGGALYRYQGADQWIAGSGGGATYKAPVDMASTAARAFARRPDTSG